MEIVGPPTTLNIRPEVVTGVLRIRGDVRENRKDKLVWEFENCEVGSINTRSKEQWYESSY